MSVDRTPPFAARWSEGLGFWFYLDRAGPGGLGGWIAPPAVLEAEWIDVQFDGKRVRAKLRRDADPIGGRPLYRFSVSLRFPARALVMFGVAGKTFARLVLSRGHASPPALPAPPRMWGEPAPISPAQGRALVVLAPIDWSFRRQRSQQLAQALSHSYDATFYLGPASLHLDGSAHNASERIALPLLGAAPECDFATRGLSETEARACADGLTELLGNASVDVLVQFPSWRAVATLLPNARVIYDCIDDHARLPHVTAPLDADERALAQEAALCLATSDALHERLTSLGARNVMLAPNAAQAPEPNAWPHHRDAAIVYLGAVEDWFDFVLLQAAALSVPEAQVRVIGACNVTPPSGLSGRIRFLGEHDYASAMRALRHARVGIIPFQRGALADAVNPVKAYEYLAAGLPVVMTPMGGTELANAPGVSVAETADTFAQAVARAYADTTDADRQSFAKWVEGETWITRASQILARLNA